MENRLPRQVMAAGPTNSDIRKAASKLYSGNLLPLILVYGVSVLLASVPNYLINNLPGQWPTLVSWLFTVIFYPVTAIGAARVMLSVWDGEKPAFSQLFCCLTNRTMFLRALCYGLFFRTIMALTSALYSMTSDGSMGGPLKIACTLLYLASYVFTIRAAVTPYLLASDETSRLFPSLRYSLIQTKGKFWRYVWLALSVYWIIFLIIATCSSLMIGMQQQTQQSAINNALLLPSLVANIAVGPLLQLTLAGFLRTMLPGAQKTDAFAFANGADEDIDEDTDEDADEPDATDESAPENQSAADDTDVRWG